MTSIIFIVLVVTLFSVIQLVYNINKIDKEKNTVGQLPTVNSKEKLTSLLTKYSGNINQYRWRINYFSRN